MDLNIIPYPGEPNQYFIGVDPYGYDGMVATCCVMKRESSNHLGEVVALYKGRPDNYFNEKVQEYIDFFKISATRIAIF